MQHRELKVPENLQCMTLKANSLQAIARVSVAVLTLAVPAACSTSERGPGILPDCDQATVEQQAAGQCMNRPVPPEEKTVSG